MMSVRPQQPTVSCRLLLQLLTLLLLLLADSSHRVQAHGQHAGGEDDHSDHGLGDFADENSEISNPLHQSDFIKHKEHLIEHLALPMHGNHAAMSDEEINFHFFQSHDTDHDGCLDGLELYQSVLHGITKQLENTKMDAEEEKRRKEKIMARLVHTVDRILLEDDKDGDGYITYPEFGTARLASVTLKRGHVHCDRFRDGGSKPEVAFPSRSRCRQRELLDPKHNLLFIAVHKQPKTIRNDWINFLYLIV